MHCLPSTANITDGWDLPNRTYEKPKDFYLPSSICPQNEADGTQTQVDTTDYLDYLKRHPSQDGLAAGYPEHIAKSHSAVFPAAKRSTAVRLKTNWEKISDEFHNADTAQNAVGACARKYLECELPSGDKIYKAMYCGRDWCPTCGKRGSVVHRRRVGRLWHRWLTFKQWGYFVFTIAPEQRPYINRDVLDKLATYLKRKFQAEGFEHGFERWHWAGEDGTTWKPHINLILERGAIGRTREDFIRIMAQYREDWAQALVRIAGCPYVAGQVHYEWAKKISKAVHWLKYIYRPTYSGSDVSVINTINGFRNSRTWGKFAKPTQESKDEALKHLQGLDKYREKPFNTQIITRKRFEVIKISQKLEYIGLGIWKKTAHLPELTGNIPIPDL
jgi:hypothetical protein